MREVCNIMTASIGLECTACHIHYDFDISNIPDVFFPAKWVKTYAVLLLREMNSPSNNGMKLLKSRRERFTPSSKVVDLQSSVNYSKKAIKAK